MKRRKSKIEPRAQVQQKSEQEKLLPKGKYHRLRFRTEEALRNHSFAVGFTVFLLAFTIFCSNQAFFIASDARGITASADWIAQGHGLSLNTHPSFKDAKGMAGYWGQELPDGRMVSVYPICAAVSAAPFFKVAHMLGYSKSILAEGQLAKWIAAAMMAIAVWACWKTARVVTGEIEAALLAFMIAAGTPFFATLSQSLWMQTPAIMAQGLSLALASSWLFSSTKETRKPPIGLLLCGFFAAWTAACRPNLAIWTILLCLAAAWQLRKRSVWVFVGAALSTGLFLILNQMTYGSVTGLYGDKAAGVGFNFSLDTTFIALAGLLISPGRGLLIFCPWTILIFFGLILILRDKRIKNPGLLCISTFVLISLLMISMFGQWWGGWSGGPRLQSDVLVPGGILAAIALQTILRNMIFILIPLILMVPSVWVQYNGSRMLNYYWEEFMPKEPSKFQERLWDWKHGNIHWVYAKGRFEREIRGETQQPLTGFPGFLLDPKNLEVDKYLQNGFFISSSRPGIIQTRASESRIIFEPATLIPGPYELAITCGDTATWGTVYEVTLLLNSEPVGVLDLLSGTRPSTFTFPIPGDLLIEGINTLTIIQDDPPRDSGVFNLLISSLAIVSQNQSRNETVHKVYK